MPQTQQNSNCTFEHQMAHRHSGLVNYIKTFVTLRWNFIPFESRYSPTTLIKFRFWKHTI